MDRAEQSVNVVVSIADEHLDDLIGVLARLRQAGLRVDDVLDAVGMVTGTVDLDGLEALESLPGVAGVEVQRSVRVAPPEAELQ